MTVNIKSIYDIPQNDDGMRFLIESELPTDVSKDHLNLTGWIKELAPPPALKTMLVNNEDSWKVFRRNYYQLLMDPSKELMLHQLTEHARFAQITLVYDAKDKYRNHATVLKTLIELRLRMDNEY